MASRNQEVYDRGIEPSVLSEVRTSCSVEVQGSKHREVSNFQGEWDPRMMESEYKWNPGTTEPKHAGTQA